MKSGIPKHSKLENGLPIVDISISATKESWRKEIYSPATSTHKWWAKRLGSVFRGVMRAAFEPAGIADKESSSDKSDRIVLDPFAGSGVIGVEAIKLGYGTAMIDINPVATLVQKQAVARWDLDHLNYLYEKVSDLCSEKICALHRTEDGEDVLYYFWVAVGTCPECGERIPLFNSTIYAKHAYPKKYPTCQVVCPECLDIGEDHIGFVEHVCANQHNFGKSGPVRGSKVTCKNGHTVKTLDTLNNRKPEFEMYAKLVLRANGKKEYMPINDFDRKLYDSCSEHLSNFHSLLKELNVDLEDGYNTQQAIRWGFKSWIDFFNARQLLSLGLMAKALIETNDGSNEWEALVTLFSGVLEFNNLFASYKGEGTGAVRHMFSNHVLKPERTPLEAHPWGTPASSGAFSTLFKSRILRAYEFKKSPFDLAVIDDEATTVSGVSFPLEREIVAEWPSDFRTRAYIATSDSGNMDIPDASVDLVCTDPPYMDNVHYSELADFFHVWLRFVRPYRDYPEEPTTRSNVEVQDVDPKKFGDAIFRVWRECHRVIKPGGMLAFSFQQSSLSGWVKLVASLHRAGFVVTAVKPVKAEMSTSIVKSGVKEPSNLDSIVVCRRKIDGFLPPWSTLNDAVESVINDLSELHKAKIDVGKGDVRSSVRGASLSWIFSKYGQVTNEMLDQIDDMANQRISEFFRDGLRDQ